MTLAFLNNDIIRSITTLTDDSTEIGTLPSGVPLEELRWDSTALITISDSTAVTELYVEEPATSVFILHCCDSTNYEAQLVTMVYSQRNILINDQGTIRVKTQAELDLESDALTFDSGVVQAENIIEQQIRYDRKISSDIIITDKSLRDPDDLKVLYNGNNDDSITIDSTSDLVIDTTAEINFWLQYKFPVERMIKKVFNYGTFNTTSPQVVAAYFAYSLNGTDWTYLGYDSTSQVLIEYDDHEDAKQYYYSYTDADMTNEGIAISLLRGVAAKYFRILFLEPSTNINDWNFDLTEFRFNEIVKAQEIEVETLSAFSADVGLLEAGVIQSTNFDDGGVKLDLDNDVMEVYDSLGVLRVELGKLS